MIKVRGSGRVRGAGGTVRVRIWVQAQARVRALRIVITILGPCISAHEMDVASSTCCTGMLHMPPNTLTADGIRHGGRTGQI